MKFLADEMLGRLAKWLRILGYDVAYTVPISGAELLRRATAEGRIYWPGSHVQRMLHPLAEVSGEWCLVTQG